MVQVREGIYVLLKDNHYLGLLSNVGASFLYRFFAPHVSYQVRFNLDL